MKILTNIMLAALCAASIAQEIGSAWLVRQKGAPVPVAFAPLGGVRNLFGTGVSASLRHGRPGYPQKGRGRGRRVWE